MAASTGLSHGAQKGVILAKLLPAMRIAGHPLAELTHARRGQIAVRTERSSAHSDEEHALIARFKMAEAWAWSDIGQQSLARELSEDVAWHLENFNERTDDHSNHTELSRQLTYLRARLYEVEKKYESAQTEYRELSDTDSQDVPHLHVHARLLACYVKDGKPEGWRDHLKLVSPSEPAQLAPPACLLARWMAVGAAYEEDFDSAELLLDRSRHGFQQAGYMRGWVTGALSDAMIYALRGEGTLALETFNHASRRLRSRRLNRAVGAALDALGAILLR